MSDPRVSVVIITRNRGRQIFTALWHLLDLPERPHIILVDNGSSDETVKLARTFGPAVDVIALDHNKGGAGRNFGVSRANTPYVAFSDDDSWWAPGALPRAADLLDADKSLGLIAARILVGPQKRLDPICRVMARSGLATQGIGHRAGTGVPITSFVACGAVVRRDAFLAAGGFDPRFGVGGEEEVLALDLLRQGWGLAYVREIVAYHHPSPVRNVGRRQRQQVRNALWSAWMRRPAPSALRVTWRIASAALRDGARRPGLVDAVVGLPGILSHRDPIPHTVDRQVSLAEEAFYSRL